MDTKWVLTTPKLTHIDKLVALYIAYRYDGKPCYEKVASIAQALGIGYWSCSKSLRHLGQASVIRKVKRKRISKELSRTNVYIANFNYV